MKLFFQKLLSNIWLRILLFLVLFILFYFTLIPINDYFFLHDYYLNFIGILLATLIIDYFRVESKWFASGIKLDYLALNFIFKGFLYSLIPFLFFLLFKIFILNEKVYFEFPATTEILKYSTALLFLALSEELLFRGVIFQSLIEKFNPLIISIIISLVFSFLHLANFNSNSLSTINTFIAGLLFSYMYIQTKSLWLPISFHFFWNWFQPMLLDLPISGYNYNISLLKFEHTQNMNYEIFLGNSYGIEASIVTTFFLILLFYFTSKVKYSPFQSSILLKRKYAEAALRHKSIKQSSKSYENKKS